MAFELDAIVGGTPGYRDMLETIGLPDEADRRHDVELVDLDRIYGGD